MPTAHRRRHVSHHLRHANTSIKPYTKHTNTCLHRRALPKTQTHIVTAAFLAAGERRVRQVPGRVLSGVLHALQVLRHPHQLDGGRPLVDLPLLHVQTRRAQVLRDLHHHHDLRLQPRAREYSQHHCVHRHVQHKLSTVEYIMSTLRQ